MTVCWLSGYHCFRGVCCFLLHDVSSNFLDYLDTTDGGSKSLKNATYQWHCIILQKTCTFTENPLTTTISEKFAASNLICLSSLFLDCLESEDRCSKILWNASNCNIYQSPQCHNLRRLESSQKFHHLKTNIIIIVCSHVNLVSSPWHGNPLGCSFGKMTYKYNS